MIAPDNLSSESLVKSVPANLEAERAVLGSLLIDPDALIKVANFLRVADFYRERHGWIYEAMLALNDRREPIDFVTLQDELERREQLSEIGGPAYISDLSTSTPTSIYVDHYARIVERTALLRRLIAGAGKIVELAYDESQDANQVLERAEQIIFGISESRVHRDLQPIHSVMQDVVNRLDFLSRNQDTLMGVSTGFHAMDKLLGGFQQSDLIIVAARPGMGKSSLALSVAQKAAQNLNARVAVFSLEMSSEQLVQRLLSMETRIDSHRLRLGQVYEEEWPILLEVANSLANSQIFIDDTPGASVSDIRTKARRLYAEHGLDLLIIDYMQLMTGQTGSRNENRQQEISYISRSLKELARELNVPVIALSQLSRAVESRADKRPMLSDLRESGCLAGDSLITLSSGQRVPIAELCGQAGFEVFSLNPDTLKLEHATVTNAFCTGEKQVFTLQTQLGRSIRATANHQFLTVEGWKRLDRLDVGEAIALPQQNEVYWGRITDKECDGIEPVYDLTVPGNHNFVANNIIVHNSIEQDADVVMFIYREDYYIEDTDRQNIADVIVAKHRHGSTGTVSLYFRKELTQFNDMEIHRTELDY
ncbi:MAG: replicative DNA helicase [Caldilineaceae bacterium]